ncbi:hypothetical protein [Bizionia paragorgiae]|uniref:hypothetical protein n=1 Tax=Bizionia paragorgiae TaxID=283786 RepID=UPI003A946A40
MKAIGGYFELELNDGNEFHQQAIRLNTGRNAFEYILKANKYKKVYLPYFTCDALLEPLEKLQIPFEFYSINTQLEPSFDFDLVTENVAFLYINYFGLKDAFITSLSKKCKSLIIDNSQSFFSKPEPRTDTFYSARKFFGVPDGAYLYCNNKLNTSFEMDESFDKCSHLLKRIDVDAETGFDDFKNNEMKLRNQEIKQMSSLSKSILSNIDYKNVLQRRVENFDFLDAALKQHNKFRVGRGSGVPMVYPFWCNDKSTKKRLLEQKIYTATYWDNVKQWIEKESLEYQLVDEIVYLPIDQRNALNDMTKILSLI